MKLNRVTEYSNPTYAIYMTWEQYGSNLCFAIATGLKQGTDGFK